MVDSPQSFSYAPEHFLSIKVSMKDSYFEGAPIKCISYICYSTKHLFTI